MGSQCFERNPRRDAPARGSSVAPDLLRLYLGGRNLGMAIPSSGTRSQVTSTGIPT
jgi:hypothetical protein